MAAVFGAYDNHDGRVALPRHEHHRRVVNQVDIRWNLRDASNPLDISVPEFRKLYRMPQHVLMELVRILAPYCPVRTHHNAVPLLIRVLTAVGFYASGSYQRVTGRGSDVSVCQASVSNYIEEVTDAFNHPGILAQFLHFPETPEEREQVITRNARLGLPRVLGFVDGSLVKIVPPSIQEHREAYYCRKGYTALNIQVVCDADLRILTVDARFPGSCNDPYIFKNCGLRDVMIQAYRENRCWLLGDSGYGHEPWLQLPLPHAARGTPEYRYTKAHCKARNAVERCFGVLKGRWRCLLCDRTLHYNPVKAGKIVNACCVLHNFLREQRVELPPPVCMARDQGEDRFEGIDVPLDVPRNLRILANQELQYLINHVNGHNN